MRIEYNIFMGLIRRRGSHLINLFHISYGTPSTIKFSLPRPRNSPNTNNILFHKFYDSK